MIEKAEMSHQNLEMELNDICSSSVGAIDKLDKSIITILKGISELKQYVVDYQFKDDREEIYFFKEVKPKFFGQLIYHSRQRNIEINRPLGCLGSQRTYLLSELKRIEQWFKDNKDFVVYYRCGYIHLDEIYFLKRNINWQHNLLVSLYDSDHSFSTNHDHTWAQIIGFELLINYLNQCLIELESGIYNPDPAQKALRWTGSKASLIELVYALQSTGVFNHSSADLKLIFEAFENLFDVQLGNYYRAFQEIRIRKSGRTNFLDQLKAKLVERMDEADRFF